MAQWLRLYAACLQWLRCLLKGVQVQFLVRELRSYMLCCKANRVFLNSCVCVCVCVCVHMHKNLYQYVCVNVQKEISLLFNIFTILRTRLLSSGLPELLSNGEMNFHLSH